MQPISHDELKRRMLQCGGISPDDAENEAVMELFAAKERAEEALREVVKSCELRPPLTKWLLEDMAEIANKVLSGGRLALSDRAKELEAALQGFYDLNARGVFTVPDEHYAVVTNAAALLDGHAPAPGGHIGDVTEMVGDRERRLADCLEEILNYAGGADNALEDEYVMDRARAALAGSNAEDAPCRALEPEPWGGPKGEEMDGK